MAPMQRRTSPANSTRPLPVGSWDSRQSGTTARLRERDRPAGSCGVHRGMRDVAKLQKHHAFRAAPMTSVVLTRADDGKLVLGIDPGTTHSGHVLFDGE